MRAARCARAAAPPDPGTFVGRSLTVYDAIDPMRVRAMHAALGRPGPAPGPGAPLPPFWHWGHFWDVRPLEHLGEDGAVRPGLELVPDAGLPQRMWAGSRLRFPGRRLLVGEAAARESSVQSVARKQGRGGPLCLVTLLHRFRGADGTVCVEEEQDLVYLEAAQPGAARAPGRRAPSDEDAAQTHAFGPVSLFQYSALTFSSHRRHYDVDYCRRVEGHAKLVVNGPLISQLLVHMADDRLPAGLSAFSYRGLSLVFCEELFQTCCKAKEDGSLSLWVRDKEGCLVMTAEAT